MPGSPSQMPRAIPEKVRMEFVRGCEQKINAELRRFSDAPAMRCVLNNKAPCKRLPSVAAPSPDFGHPLSQTGGVARVTEL